MRVTFDIAHISRLEDPNEIEQEVAAALEVGSEEAELHAKREPGRGAGGCGDKFCSHASHDLMAQRAALLDAMADQLRHGTEGIRIP